MSLAVVSGQNSAMLPSGAMRWMVQGAVDDLPLMAAAGAVAGQRVEAGCPDAVQQGRSMMSSGFAYHGFELAGWRSRMTDHAIGAAAAAPTICASPKCPCLWPHHIATTYSGFQATVHASRFAEEVPVFHAARGRRVSAMWPRAACERAWPERMSDTIQQAAGEKINVPGGAGVRLSSACGRV